MLVEAHNHPASRHAGRIGRWAVVVLLCLMCLMSIALTLSAEASASVRGGGALGAVVQTAQELPSTAGATVAQVAGTPVPAPASSPPATVAQPVTPAQSQTPASSPVSHASPPPPTDGRGTAIGTIVDEARERIAPAGATPPSLGRSAVGTIVHTATAVVRAVPSASAITDVVQRAGVSPPHAGELVHAVTQTLAHTSPPGRTAPSKLPRSQALTETRQSAAARRQALASATALAAPPSSMAMQAIAGRPPLAAPLLLQGQDSFGGLRAWADSPDVAAAARMPSAEAAQLRQSIPVLLRGESAASSPAHGARPAPLPASPAPTPSPGGVSPVAAVGAGAGLSSVLGLAALLMLAAPFALRRLRLDGESWRLAPFVLIADRPG